MRAVSRFRAILLIGLAFPVLAGCGHMPVTSLVRLAQVDFQTTSVCVSPCNCRAC
jgi:hypothetical protein